MNTKSNFLKSIFISLILLVGATNAWAYNLAANQYVYFEKPDNWSQASLLLGHGSYSIGYSMTNISNTKLYYWKTEKWDGYTEYFFMQDKWGSEGNSPTHRNQYAGSNKTSVFKTEFKKYHLFTTAGSKLNSTSSYSVINKTQTIKAQIKNGANWEDATVVPADLTASTYALTSETATGAKSASLTKESTTVSATVDAAYSATVSLSHSNVLEGYTFDGWYDANGNKITSYTVSDAHTVYARFKENTYSVTISAGSGGTVSPSGSKTIGQVTKTTVTATANANYEFVNWTATGGVVVANTTSASTTITATAAGTLKANFRSTATNSLTVVAGAGIESVTGSTDPVTLGNPCTITATPKTGYTFSTWTAEPAANATFGSATTANTTVTVKNGSVTVTATATEILYAITVKSSNKDHGTVTPSTGEAGIATPITITATPEDGYKFVNWTTQDAGITIADAESATTTINATAAGTVTANFEEIPLETIYFVNKDNWSKVNVYRWGGSAASEDWPGIEATKADFQLNCCDVYFVSAESGSYKNCIFSNNGSSQTADLNWEAGKYFHDNAWKTLDELTYEVQLAGSMLVNNGNWVLQDMTMDANNSTGSITVSLDANKTYKFKIVVDGNWHGNNGIMTNGHSTDWTMSTSEGDCQITTTAAGEYTFTYNVCGAKLTVTYPTLTQYTITYNTNGGEEISQGEYNVTTATFNLPTPTKTGYTFAGWYDNSNLTGTAVTQITKGTTGDKEFWANWTINSHKVTWKPNGGNWSGNSTNRVDTYTYGATIEQPSAPSRIGYEFNGWKEEKAAEIGVEATMPDRDLTYTAQWEANSNTSYVVKHYKQNLDGSYPQEATETENFTGTTGAEVTPAVKLYEGFTAPATQTCTIAATGNLIVTYEYTRNSYQLTWNLDGGEITNEGTAAGQVKFETPLTPPTVEKTGYTFAGWNTEVASTMPDNDLTYTAQWTANKYTVTFDGNGATGGSMSEQGFTYGSEQTLTKNGFTYGDYVFLGWSKEEKGTVEYTDQQSVSNLTTENNGKVVLYAIWATPKNIYLKTVEGTEDGVKWYVRYNSTEDMMTPLGCTGEYYQGEVPEETEFQLIAKDNGGNIIAKETRDGLVAPDDNRNMLNLVSIAAGGNKIFFKPNQQWVDEASNNNYYFAGRFWTGSAVRKQMTDDNGDGIYECERPANGNEVIFCLVNTTDKIDSWGDNWNYKKIQTNGNDTYKLIPNGSNYFTITDNNKNDAIGTWSTHADTPVNGEGEWTIFEGATYRITFNHAGATSGTTTSGVAYVDAQYNSAMPTIESLPKNTDWKFAGYYTAANGGTAITNAFGDWLNVDEYISNGKWVKEECVTLYAHWVVKTPEITNVALSKNVFDVGSVETVTATPTVDPHSYTGDIVICWKLLDNSGTVMDLFPFTSGDNNSVSFSVDGLTSGTYIVRASIYASACDTGEELSRFDAKITIVSGYKVTVKYLCGDNVIKVSDIYPGHATTPTPITAPEIGGYKFVNWELGDGIFSESDLNSQTISYTAIYDGYLTAKYEKRKLIFLDLSNQFGETEWTEPHIYLYSGSYWDNTNGTGGNHAKCIANGAMTRVGTSNIWYYDYESVKNFNGYVAFTPTDQSTSTRFKDTEAIYRYDFSSGTPVFVPAQGQIPLLANQVNGTKAQYYNKGHWTKYTGGTGYTLKIYNKKENERTEVMSVPFTGSSLYLPFTAIADLEEGKTYGYKIVRDNDKWYKNDADGTMTSTSCTDWPFIEDNSNGYACGIQTVATGDHTFTLTLNATTGNLEVSVDYPAKVGNYRILYTDDVREGRYKPSQIISQNNKEPLVSFFIRPNKNPTLKVQSAAHVTSEGVTWATTENEIFFKPNANWKSDGARFAAYFYNASNNEWVDMKANGDLYSCAKPTDKAYTHVIFVRMNPNGSDATNNKLNWNNKWNQTGHLALTTNNLYTLKEGEWGNKLYLKPNNNWTQAGAWFAAYFFETGKNDKWVGMTSAGDGIYVCDIPAENYKNVSFVRMNPDGSDGTNNKLNWTNKWNQTSDLTVPTDGNTLFTVKDGDWNNAGGSWSEREGSWSTINGSITDLSNELKSRIGELGLNLAKDTGSVFNIHLSNNEGRLTIDKVALYTGNYYIRVDAVDGKWYDYKTNPDNLMTYSAFSESKENSFGEKFSHYKTKWCSREKGAMNVKFVIANDYSLCISDTLTQDEGNPFGNIDEHGNITNDGKYDANIRFMWNRHTNKVSRAYVAGASGNNTRFLVLKADQTIQNESGQEINNNEVVFTDTQNWLYEHTIKVQPGTLVKLIAYYPDGNKAQYFRGTSANGFEENVSAVQILGGTNKEWYTMRLIYDFKTNRLMAAWVPDQNINGTLEIDADIMVIRQHQEDATYITFAKNGGQLTEVKTVYGVMRFNRWTLNNRSTTTHDVLPVQNQKSIYERALYFISFPFDVHLSDVFGFGTYGTHWVISEYNGLRRATNGYFIDNCMNEDCTNWDYIWDPDDFTMKANQGYLLSLDLDLMKSDNTSFWEHDIQQVELFFPSFAHVKTIQQTSYTMPALTEDYKCTINFNKVEPGENGYNPDNDHRVRDSYWRCIGVPSFADYNNTLTDGTNPITWQPKGSDLPFLYEWNVSDNSLMVRAATNYKFRSTFAYLVQNGNPIYWSAVNTKPSNIVARSQEAKRNYEWRIAISRNGEVEDQTFVRLSDNEQVTTEFDFNQDLSKEFNYGRSDIYTLIGYEKAAANSLPISEQTTVIPLGLSIEYNGDYTLAMPDRVNGIGVTLVDNQTGTRTNLSAGMEYTLTLNKGDYNNRFFIEISPIQQTPTDIEYVTGDSNSQDSVRKVLIDNILYIVRDGQIFDARGARVK